jgi:hypothetical protein
MSQVTTSRKRRNNSSGCADLPGKSAEAVASSLRNREMSEARPDDDNVPKEFKICFKPHLDMAFTT